MQTEKEFKELAQAWIDDDFDIDNMRKECIMQLMWLSYNQAIKDMQKGE